VLARLAPVTFLVGIGVLDVGWYGQKMPPFLIGSVTPWAPVLLLASVAVVFLAASLQSPFYYIVGLASLAYAVSRIAFEIEVKGWLWPLTVMVAGLALTAWLTWRDLRERAGQDIDDVGEQLIRQSRKRLYGPRR
jgi:H+/Cl- antiporter ClcA